MTTDTTIWTRPPNPSRSQDESPQLRELTKRIVGRVFYATLLAEARRSSLKTGVIDGGRGEQAFGAQLDETYAEQIGLKQKGGLADVLYERLAAQQRRIGRADGLARSGGEA